ncbi:MAG: Fe-S cluster assembly protein SufD [Rikenellaceae bacterium]
MMNKSIDKILVDLFRLNSSRLLSHYSSSINDLREEAIQKFTSEGLPTNNDEAYRYSNVTAWMAAAVKENATIVTDSSSRMAMEQNRTGVVICDLNTFAEEYKEIFDKYYAGSEDENAFMMLSRAFVTGGKVVYVPHCAVVEGVIKLSASTEEGKAVLGERNLFIFENESLAKIHIEHNDNGVVNRVCEIFVNSGANIEISEEYYGSKESLLINTISTKVERDTFYRHTTVNMSLGKSRVTEFVTLDDKGADVALFGAVLSRENAHIDNTTLIRHSVENCKSYENFKYVTADTATSVFCGNIFVAAGANGTQAYQQNNNILLGDTANMYTKPNLEIYADDVKCSHGATVGQLDETALFYMRQRGISMYEAKKLMLRGFLKDIVNKISTPEIVEKISERLENV